MRRFVIAKNLCSDKSIYKEKETFLIAKNF